MKSFRRFSLVYAVVLAAAALFSATVEAAGIVHNKAVIRSIRGSAKISTDKGASWKTAKVGQSLGANSMVQTGAAPGNIVDLFLGENGPVVRVREDSIMGIDKLDLENTGIEKVIETQLDLKNGQILGSVKKMAAASRYEVTTPVGVAGIRGTEYSINSKGLLKVVSGTVVIVYVVDGVRMPAVTVTGGNQATPPLPGGTAAVLTQMTANDVQTVTGEVTEITVGIITKPDGTSGFDNDGDGQSDDDQGGDDQGGDGDNQGGDGDGEPPRDTTLCALTPGDPNRPAFCETSGGNP